MDKCDPLRADSCRAVRQQKIVVNQSRTVRNLYEQILAERQTCSDSGSFRCRVIVEQVLCNPCPLGLPVQPDSSCTMMNMISPVDHINGGMHLDPADLGSGKILLVVDVVNLVVLNQRKNTAKMADDSRLSAVMNIAAPDHVGTDCFP